MDDEPLALNIVACLVKTFLPKEPAKTYIWDWAEIEDVMKNYETEARSRWGNTDAYFEHEQKTKKREK